MSRGDRTKPVRVLPRIMEMTFKQNVLDGFIVFTVLIQPLLVAFLALWMLRDKGSEYAMYVVVGSGMTSLWSSVLFIGGNSINIERWSGTLETLVGVPTPMATIVIGKNFANVIQSLVSMVITFAFAAFAFGYSLTIPHPLLFSISLLLTVVAFVSFGLILSPLFVMNPAVQQWQNGLEFPVYILSGFLFPVLMLPSWIRPVSYLLPPYWAARALHESTSSGGSSGGVLLSWGMLALFSGAYILLSGWLFKAMIRKAKRDATLDME